MLRNTFRFLDTSLEYVTKFFAQIAAIATLAMVFVTTYGVVMRYFFRRPDPITNELATIFLLWGYLFAVSLVQFNDRHIKADIFTSFMPKGFVNALHRIVSPVLGVVYSGLLAWKGWTLALYSREMNEVSLSVWAEPLFPIKVAIPICYALLTLTFFRSLVIGIGSYGHPTRAPSQ
jgi:TRAP-type C4-dicarboxylate transport system permease small subunit